MVLLGNVGALWYSLLVFLFWRALLWCCTHSLECTAVSVVLWSHLHPCPAQPAIVPARRSIKSWGQQRAGGRNCCPFLFNPVKEWILWLISLILEVLEDVCDSVGDWGNSGDWAKSATKSFFDERLNKRAFKFWGTIRLTQKKIPTLTGRVLASSVPALLFDLLWPYWHQLHALSQTRGLDPG